MNKKSRFILSLFLLALLSFCLPSQATELKVLQSLIAPESMTTLILENYSLREEISSKFISSGDNDSYLVTTAQDRYILRIYRYNKFWMQKEENFLFEYEWLNFLKENGLSVSTPIKRNDGKFLGKLTAPEGKRYWALFTYADGERELDTQSAETFGKSVAQIHLTSNHFKSSYSKHQANLNFLLDKPLERIINRLKNEREEDLNYLRELATKLREAIMTIPFTGDEYGIIGGDFHGYNHHITKEGDITHFDFDLCGYGWRAYDIAVLRWARAEDDDAMWEAFLKGYNQIRPLSENELKAIPFFILIRQIWIMGFHTTYPGLNLVKEYWDEQFASLHKLEKQHLLFEKQ